MRSLAHCIVGALLGTALFEPSLAFAAPTETVPVAMSDGVALTTDVYLPDGAGPFPVLVIRTPYDRAGSAGVGDGLRDSGIATVAQDLRGRFDSEGVDCIFRCDGEDGFDTLAWIAQQSWCNGRVVSWGGSALGIVQYMAAPHAPPVLDAMWVEVATPSVYDHLLFQGGSFRQALVETWLAGQGSEFFLDVLSGHPLEDGTWDSVQTSDRFGQVVVPAVHYGGWYDILDQGTIDAFVGYQHSGGPGAKGKQKLVMGPWTHGLSTVPSGELTYPANSAGVPGGTDQMLLAWLEYYLGLESSSAAVDAIPTVQYYVMGDVDDPSAPGNDWRTAEDWPVPAAAVRMHLQTGGGLAESCPSSGEVGTSYTYDPSNPSPTVGGANLALPAGSFDQSEIEARADVVVFTSPVLSAPVEITGRVRARLWVETDAVDTDVAVRMTDVYPDGRSMLVLDGIARLGYRNGAAALAPVPQGEPVEVTVDLWSTSIILNAGHRLRISITSSNAPRFWPNPNDGSTYGQSATPTIAQLTVLHDADHPSYLEVPNPQREPASVIVCGPDLDAGTDADADPSAGGGGGAPDGAIGGSPLAPTAPSMDSGCGCRAGAGRLGHWHAAWWTALFAGIVRHRRRRARLR